MYKNIVLMISFYIGLMTVGLVSAATVDVYITDPNNNPIEDVVISLKPKDQQELTMKQDSFEMIQQNNQFVPHILPIMQGTQVFFPNKDDVYHHVYSFSQAKKFEFKLYSKNEINSLVFDNPGVVIVGCNIHDWMSGYIYVLDTPAFAKTDNFGIAKIENIPTGRYKLNIWHPQLMDNNTTEHDILVVEEHDNQLKYNLKFKNKFNKKTNKSYPMGYGY